jgi:hypothetical protein
MRIHLASVIFKVSRISRVRSEGEHCHHGAAALTRNELALDHFLGFRRAPRNINRSSVFRSSTISRIRVAEQDRRVSWVLRIGSARLALEVRDSPAISHAATCKGVLSSKFGCAYRVPFVPALVAAFFLLPNFENMAQLLSFSLWARLRCQSSSKRLFTSLSPSCPGSL